MAYGITLLMREIKKPEPEWVHHHDNTGMGRMQRRAAGRRGPGGSESVPYINLARDQKAVFGKKGRRLTAAAFLAAWEAAHQTPEAA